MRRGPILASLLVFALSIVSTVFTLLAATSKSWSTQAYYFDNPGPDGQPTELGQTEITPVCYWERSPFYRCGLPRVNATGSCEILDCSFYPPQGYNQTSCRSAAEFGVNWGADDTDAIGLLGRSTECQEVHYAGNLQIAASFFLVIGLLFALVLSAFTVVLAMAPPDAVIKSQHGHRHRHQYRRTGEQQDSGAEERSAEDDEPRSRHGQPSWDRSLATPYVVAAALACFYIGSLMQILAQYFGVLGLTVNATPTANDAQGTQKNATLANYAADSWAIGPGLSTYATTAWASALVCAAVATTVFRTPRFAKLL